MKKGNAMKNGFSLLSHPAMTAGAILLSAGSVASATPSSEIPAAFRGAWYEEANTVCGAGEEGFLTVSARGYESPVAEGTRIRVQSVSPTSIRVRYTRVTEEGGSHVAASEVWTLRNNGRHLNMADARPGATLDITDLYRCTPRRGR